jgi:hypothetical protein
VAALRRVWLLAAAHLLVLSLGGVAWSATPVRHVFILMLENENAAVTFASDPPSSYLARTLPAQGALLPNYYGIGHASLDNYIALISGQAPNQATQLDCPMFTDFQPSQAALDTHGQLPGIGCIYPNLVKTCRTSWRRRTSAGRATWRIWARTRGGSRRRAAIRRSGRLTDTHCHRDG